MNAQDVNDPPVISNTEALYNLEENRPAGYPIFTVLTSDEDRVVHGDTVTFNVTGGNRTLFFVDPITGVLAAEQTFNFEAPPLGPLSVRKCCALWLSIGGFVVHSLSPLYVVSVARFGFPLPSPQVVVSVTDTGVPPFTVSKTFSVVITDV
jgi:hypothetical protein